MAVAITDLREVTDEHDPGSANLSLKGGKAKVSYWWTSTNVADFHNMARLILGEARADPNPTSAGADPGIKRLMPIGHPRFPSLFAETITDFAGIGGEFVKEASFDYSTIHDGSLGALAANFPQYARYPEYKIDIEFANRLYVVMDDELLSGAVATPWNDDTGSPTGDTGSPAPNAKKFWDTEEYYRWTWVTGGPKETWITTKYGQAGIDVGTGATKTRVFPDTIKVPLPDGAVVIKWFEVPYSFVRPAAPVAGASWFQLYMGRINQLKFLNWLPGELLYVTASPKPYKSPIPTTDGDLITLCDLDIIFLETKRLLAPGDDTTAPALLNWLKAGWNLQNFFVDRLFHYIHSHQGVNPGTGGSFTLPANQQVPLFRSFPTQILWSNPEVTLPP